MRSFLILCRREISAFFLTPTAYGVTAAFLAISGAGFWFLVAALSAGPESSARAADIFGWLFLLAMLIAAPLLTMRLFSEEYRSGTFETLMTAPVREADVVLAKYVGALTAYAVMLASTLVYGPLLRLLAAAPPVVELSALAGVYGGAFLIGAFLLSLGLLASALTRSQVASGLMGVAMIVLFYLGGLAPYVWRSGAADPLGRMASPVAHMAEFSQGIVDTRPIAFYVINTAWVLFAAVRALESRRWR